MDIARENLAIERLARIAPHKIRPHRADQVLQQPHARPLADRVAQRRRGRRHVGDQHIVHVGAVVHDEDHGGIRIDRLHRGFVHVAEAHAIEKHRDAAREPRADAEIRIGRERRHDLLRVEMRPRLRGRARHFVRRRVVLDRAQYFGIEDELIDQRLALGELERLDAQLEPRVQFLDRAVETAAHEPAHGGHEDAIERRPDRERAHDQSQP